MTEGEMDSTKRAILKTTFDAYPVVKSGNSWAVVIPKLWLDVYGVKIDGRTWVRMRVDEAGEITISGLDPKELREVLGADDDRETE